MKDDLPNELRDVDSRLLTASVRPPKPLITKEGWRQFIERKPVARPPIVSVAEVAKWSSAHQARYKAVRNRHHAMLAPLSTPVLSQISEAVVRMALTGIDLPPGVRPGALINGRPTLGKSTILLEIGRQFEQLLRRRNGIEATDDRDVEFIPVVYATLASDETIKGLDGKILSYFGCPYNPNDSESTLASHVAREAARCGTALVLLDDIHFLKARHKLGQAVNTHLKALASSISATFVYAGVHVENTGLLFEGAVEAEAQAAQTQRRFKRMDIEPFTKGSEVLTEVLNALEKQLVLLKARPGDLSALADYVHDRTDGYMGPITTLVRDGAAVAIDKGQERLSKEVLDQVLLDYASQKHFSTLA